MFDHFHLGVVQCYCWRTQVSLPSLLWDPSVLSIRDPLFRLGGSGSRPSSVAVWHLIPLFLSRPHSCPLLAVTQSRASFLAAGGHRLGWGAQRSLCRRLTLKLARQLLLACNLHSKPWWESHCFWLWCSSTLSPSESYWNVFPSCFSACHCTLVVVRFYCQPVSSLLH